MRSAEPHTQGAGGHGDGVPASGLRNISTEMIAFFHIFLYNVFIPASNEENSHTGMRMPWDSDTNASKGHVPGSGSAADCFLDSRD